MAISKKPDFQDMYDFSISIKGKDIQDKFVDIKIYQDMFCPYTFATLQMYDAESYVDKVKLGDLVSIKIETKQGFRETDGKFELALEIYDIKHRVSDKERTQMFTLELASKQFMKDVQGRIIQSFQNQPVIGIVTECLGKIGSSIEKIIDEPPTNKISMIAPNVSPLIAAHMALRYTTPRTDFFLVPARIKQSGDNIYNLVSLMDIMKRDKVATFKQGVHNREESRYHNQNLQFRKPFIQPVDNLSSIVAGYNASTLSTMDVFKRKWDKKDKKYMGTVDSKSHITYMPVVEKSFDKGQSIPESSKEWLSQRKNNFFKCMQMPICFSTFGFAKSHEWLAQPFQLHLHNHDINQRSNAPNQLFKSEKFLCTAVTHHIDIKRNYRNSWRFVNWTMEQNQS